MSLTHQTKGLRLFGLYFSTLVSASLFLNATILPRDMEVQAEDKVIENLMVTRGVQAQPTFEIEHKDLTGVKAQINYRRRSNERRREQMEEQAWRNEQRTIAQARLAQEQSSQKTKKKSKKRGNNQARPATAAPTAEVLAGLEAEEQVNFVPFDADLAAIPAKVKAGGLSEADREMIRQQIPQMAKKYLGVRYVYGGKTPRGFDCSGYTSYVMSLFGIGITGSSRHQALLGKPVDVRQVQTGDLIFFSRYGRGGRVTHVALVLENIDGKVKIIHANGPGIMSEDLFSSKYWVPKILFARNLLDSI